MVQAHGVLANGGGIKGSTLQQSLRSGRPFLPSGEENPIQEKRVVDEKDAAIITQYARISY